MLNILYITVRFPSMLQKISLKITEHLYITVYLSRLMMRSLRTHYQGRIFLSFLLQTNIRYNSRTDSISILQSYFSLNSFGDSIDISLKSLVLPIKVDLEKNVYANSAVNLCAWKSDSYSLSFSDVILWWVSDKCISNKFSFPAFPKFCTYKRLF